MRAEVLDLIEALGRVLEARGARWFLFGGQAAILHGSPRLTLDVDATVDVPLDEVEDLAGALEAAGFEARADDPVGFAERTRVLPVFHRRSGLPVDLVLAGPGLEQEFLGRAQRVEIAGVAFPVISPEDFIVMKVLAGLRVEPAARAPLGECARRRPSAQPVVDLGRVGDPVHPRAQLDAVPGEPSRVALSVPALVGLAERPRHPRRQPQPRRRLRHHVAVRAREPLPEGRAGRKETGQAPRPRDRASLRDAGRRPQHLARAPEVHGRELAARAVVVADGAGHLGRVGRAAHEPEEGHVVEVAELLAPQPQLAPERRAAAGCARR